MSKNLLDEIDESTRATEKDSDLENFSDQSEVSEGMETRSGSKQTTTTYAAAVVGGTPSKVSGKSTEKLKRGFHKAKFPAKFKKGSQTPLRRFPLNSRSSVCTLAKHQDNIQSDFRPREEQYAQLLRDFPTFKGLIESMGKAMELWIINRKMEAALNEAALQCFLQLCLQILFSTLSEGDTEVLDITHYPLFIQDDSKYYRGYGDLAQVIEYEKNFRVAANAIEIKMVDKLLGGYQLGQLCGQILALTGQHAGLTNLSTIRQRINEEKLPVRCFGTLTNGLVLVDVACVAADDKNIYFHLHTFPKEYNLFAGFTMLYMRSKNIQSKHPISEDETSDKEDNSEDDDGGTNQSSNSMDDRHNEENDDEGGNDDSSATESEVNEGDGGDSNIDGPGHGILSVEMAGHRTDFSGALMDMTNKTATSRKVNMSSYVDPRELVVPILNINRYFESMNNLDDDYTFQNVTQEELGCIEASENAVLNP